MKLEGNKTIVTTMGDVLYHPENPQGLIVVEMMDNKPVLLIGEVSDDLVTNLFVDVAKGVAFIDNSIPGEDATEGAASQYEIIANRADLRDEFVPHWQREEVDWREGGRGRLYPS